MRCWQASVSPATNQSRFDDMRAPQFRQVAASVAAASSPSAATATAIQIALANRATYGLHRLGGSPILDALGGSRCNR